MAFLVTLKDLFGTEDFYEALSLPKSASESEIRRTYRRLSLKVHPDRAEEKDRTSATVKFQCLSKIYSILSDKDKRAVYDESGEIDDEDVEQEKDWNAYWRLLFKKVSLDDIKEFEKTYKGSEEELNDLKSAYMDYEGDMGKILENVICSTQDDEHRFREILEKLITKKELPKFKCFTHEPQPKRKARKKKAEQEAVEAEEMATELGLHDSSEDGLKQMILRKQNDRAGAMDEMLSSLEAKYCKPKAPKKLKSGKKPAKPEK